ncbi:S-adenosyl-L-methionine-dependent methyltransferase [Oopsacas minuta]|uniref:Dimethyladenosine transferase 2, mitochondrial n=1 Tax=Oopsacas minuta TaxID=111878 RepID=A0AAV7JCC4_9METZ|nr:S-adenosyl-L-methionine-dependent methyltransferase [Oopsacas minuta]
MMINDPIRRIVLYETNLMKCLLENLKNINHTQSSCSIEVFKKDALSPVESPPLQSILTSQSAEMLTKRISHLNKPVFELCSGPGAVTTALLKAGAEKIISLDYNPECIESTKRIQKQFPQHLHVIRAHRRKSGDGKTVLNGLYSNIIENVQPEILNGMRREWQEESAGVLLGACQDDYSAQQLLSQYLSSLLMRSSFFQLGKIEYFILHNQFHLRKVLAKPCTVKYGRFAVLTNILCDVTVIPVKIPSWHLYPPAKKKVRQTGEFLNILHLVPKQIQPLNASNTLIDTFLRSCFRKRSVTIKQTMNELHPNSSSNLPTHLQMLKPPYITHKQYIEIINSLHRHVTSR